MKSVSDRLNRVVAAGGGAILAVGAACGGSDKGPEGPVQPTEAETWPELYEVFPADAEVLAGVSFDTVRESPIWAEHREQALAALDEDGELTQLREFCGFDPLEEVGSAIVGSGTQEDDEVVLVIRGLTREQVRTCVDAAGDVEGGTFAAHDDGVLTRYEVEDEAFWGAWLGASTLVVAPDGNPGPDELARRVEHGGGLDPASELAEFVEARVDREAGLWAGVVPDETAQLGMGLDDFIAAEPQAGYMTVFPRQALDIAAGIRLRSAGEAEELVATVESLRGLAGMRGGLIAELVDRLEVSADDEYLAAQISVSLEELRTVVDEVFEAFVGPMAGAGGVTGEVASPGLGAASGAEEPVSDEELEAFAEAYSEVDDVQREYEERLAEAETEAELHELQAQAISEMREKVEATGLDFVDYERIAHRLQEDPQLLEEVTELIEDGEADD